MWMTRIGSDSRRELTQWLDDLCGSRVHVPVWAAHEYYRHHSEGTLVNDLRKQLETLENAASGAYIAIWPHLDEPLASAASAQTQQAQVRDALREVASVAELVRDWLPRYQVHAREVIDFINMHPLQDSKVPSYFESLETIAATRFTGRVPPGFKDRNKPQIRNKEEGGSEFFSGSNHWGDLVFWKEILDDSRRRRARKLVLLTKDAKNDWRAGGFLPPVNPEDTGPGVAPTHPFLTFEAAVEAGVSEVLLVDQAKLAAVAKATAEDKTRAFFFVARTAALPAPKTKNERREEERLREMSVREAERRAIATASGMRFLDPPNIRLTVPTVTRALFASRATEPLPPSAAAFLGDLDQAHKSLSALLDESTVKELGEVGLVCVARQLSGRARQSGALAAELSDLLISLRQLPPKAAGALYFGLLADAYLEPDKNLPREAPKSPLLQELFKFQSEPWTLAPVLALHAHVKKTEKLPLYLPDPTVPKLKLTCHAHAEREPPTFLRSVRCQNMELITEAQGIAELQLLPRLGSTPATPELIADHAADIYGLPRSQMIIDAHVSAIYQLDPQAGFRNPRDVWLDMSEQRS